MDTKRQFARELRKNATDAERLLSHSLKSRQLDGFRFHRQAPLGDFIVDFLCPQARFIVELDGGQHTDRAMYDDARTIWLAEKGYRVLRFWNHEAIQNTDTVLAEIHRQLTKGFTPPQPSPSLCEMEGAQAQLSLPGADSIANAGDEP